ncbi:MAG: hypothetical protein OHK0029_40130 [Armatimonadaceae bacterium]
MELTRNEIDQLEWMLGTIEAKRLVGEELTAPEVAFARALEALTDAEQEARQAFETFYSRLPAADGEGEQLALPAHVAAQINRWVEARRVWDELVTRQLRSPIPAAPPETPQPRLRASLPEVLRVPTALPARETLTLLFAPGRWLPTANGEAITAQNGNTRVRLKCDEITGLGTEEAIRQIARHGASFAQTFFALVGLWLERNPDSSPETYMTVAASDILRYQNRKEAPRGGYHSADILAKGRDIYLLSRITIPSASVLSFNGGRRQTRTLSLGRLLSLEALEISETRQSGDIGMQSFVRFRYHLGREVYGWLAGEGPQYARLSGRLLTYHPVRQKYQILLGFCLAYYDRVNRKHSQTERRLRLPALLSLASLEVPEKRVAAFLTTIEDALEDLARDGVIPGLKLHKPPDWTELLAKRNTRAIIAQSVITYPCLPATAALTEG